MSKHDKDNARKEHKGHFSGCSDRKAREMAEMAFRSAINECKGINLELLPQALYKACKENSRTLRLSGYWNVTVCSNPYFSKPIPGETSDMTYTESQYIASSGIYVIGAFQND